MVTTGSTLTLDQLAAKASDLHRDSKARSLSQLIALQARLVQEGLSPESPAKDVAACACAWQRLEDQRQILTGFGKPKPVEARNNQPKRTRSKPATWTEPESAPPSTPQVVQDPPKPSA